MASPSFSISDFAEELDPLYRLAQTLTDSSSQAVSLTRDTFQRANEQLAGGYTPDDTSLWLRHLMVQTYYEEDPTEGADQLNVDVREDFRHKALWQLLRTAMPVAFASLSPSKRSLLLLCKVDNLSCADAAEVLGVHTDAAGTNLSDAFSELRIKLYQIASPPESQLLDRYLTDELLKRALLQFTSASLRATPTSLRERIAAKLNQAPSSTSTVRNQEDEATASGSSLATWTRRASVPAVIMVLITIAGLLGYVATTYVGSSAETNLLTLSANESRSIQMQQPVTNAEQAAVIIRDEFGLRLTPPSIEGALVRGVDIAEIAPNVRVPVLIYRDHSDDGTIPVYAYTYAQLNRYEDRINLSESVLRSLEDEQHVVIQDAGNHETALIWRQRDKIFVAIPAGEPSSLRSRIQP